MNLYQDGNGFNGTINKAAKAGSKVALALQKGGTMASATGSQDRKELLNAINNELDAKGQGKSSKKEDKKKGSGKITTQAAFEKEFDKVYDAINKGYNMDHLVPIHRVREQMGDRVSRIEFNNMMLKAQANDKIQLSGEQAPDVTPSQLADSISTPLSGLRFFVRDIEKARGQ